MMGLSFTWEAHGPELVITTATGAQSLALPEMREALERVEVLYEAAERSRLLLHTLPDRMNAAVTTSGAYNTLASTLYEAESALHFALTGEEFVLSVSEPEYDVSEQDLNVSEENQGGSEHS